MLEDEGTGAPPGVSSGYTATAGIDWVTYIDRTKRAPDRVEAIAREIEREHIEPVHNERPFNLMGYTGWMRGALRVGRRGHCAMIQLSGDTASECWTKLRGCGGSPTRLDVQATWLLSAPQPRFGQRFLRPAGTVTTSHLSTLPRNGLWKDSRGAFLGTVGARTSSRYLRVYDKGIESGTLEPGRAWRTEIEAKQGLAKAMWNDLGTAEDVRRWCLDSIAEQWQRSGYGWPLKSSSRGGPGIAALPAPPSDALKLAKWLRTSVAPAVERAARVYSREQLLVMLGLDCRGNDGS